MIFCEISIQDQEKNSISQHLKRSFQILCVILHLLVGSLATESDSNYYIDHLQQPSYNAYDLIYLCFHGQKKCICFADKTDLDLMAFDEKEVNLGIFEGRNVHFGSCSTLKMREKDIKTFKQLTKARMITGYTKDVDLTSSFIFETWLMDAINRNEEYAAKRMDDL